MKAQRFIPILFMLGGIVLPFLLTVILLSRSTFVDGVAGVSPGTKPSSSAKHAPSPTPTTSSAGGPSGTFQGPTVQGFFGPVQAVLTVSGGKITNVNITAPQDNPTSQYINSQAVPLLKSETLQAQSANINGVSGATTTSQAYYQSLQGALRAAHL